MNSVDESQEMPFPDWLPRNIRTKIRATFVALPLLEDDDEESGLVVFPPEGSDASLGMCITSKRMAKAFKTELGERCGTPPPENIDQLQEWLEEGRNELEDSEFGEFEPS